MHNGVGTDVAVSGFAALAKEGQNISGPDIHAEDHDADLYAALDKVTDKLARQLRKRKTRLSDKRRSTAQRGAERRKSQG